MAPVTSHGKHDNCHVLSFSSDAEYTNILVVLVNSVRFHIFADSKALNAKSDPDARIAKQYRDLVDNTRQPLIIEGLTHSNDARKALNGITNTHDSGHGTDDEDDADNTDSAVGLNDTEDPNNPVVALKNWMLSPFPSIFQRIAPAKKAREKVTVQEWYELPMHFYFLYIKAGRLQAEKKTAPLDLKRKMNTKFQPVLVMPKNIRNLGIPWYRAKDAIVLSASDEPEPYHLTRVEIKGKAYFLKVVDPTQPSPTHREITILKKIETLGLHKKINVPRVEGFLGSCDSKTTVFGFLQTDIEDPKPLTKMLDEDVPQEKREKWAQESERIIELLHENGIVWGDAKADNFLVDKHDELWIIDFGGSYTAGWVSPDLMETEQGDDMGLDKIVDALHDPIANTSDPSVHQITDNKRKASSGKKRKANDEDSDHRNVSDDGPRKKRARREDTSKSDTEKGSKEAGEEGRERNDGSSGDAGSDDLETNKSRCICNKPDSGDMVACDGENCSHEWFHYSCVGLKQAPKAKHWYCKECKAE